MTGLSFLTSDCCGLMNAHIDAPTEHLISALFRLSLCGLSTVQAARRFLVDGRQVAVANGQHVARNVVRLQEMTFQISPWVCKSSPFQTDASQL